MGENFPIIEVRDVTKRFTGITALKSVALQIWPGEILCLLGDNGAGKSTLIKILSGLYQPTSGSVYVDEREVRFHSPHDANALGIATVHQSGGTIPLMSIARNFFLGVEPTKGFFPVRRFDKKLASTIAVEQLKWLGITNISHGSQLVGSMSGGERQALAIARAMYFGARVLILDEPTSALGVKEAAKVLRLILQARANGVAVVFITHNAHHALSVGDHYAVLIRGAIAADFRRGDRSREEVLDLMAGGETMAELEAELEQESRIARAAG
jgi:simple sugar transport system ATP-binding protein